MKDTSEMLAQVAQMTRGMVVGRRQHHLKSTRRWLCVLGLLVTFGVRGDPAQGSASPFTGSPDTYVPSYGREAMSKAQEVQVNETFVRQCSSCHGAEGRGDGRVARMLKPRPPNFQNPEGVRRLSDDELLIVITNGRGSMPAFGSVLSEEARIALAAYVRDLSRGAER